MSVAIELVEIVIVGLCFFVSVAPLVSSIVGVSLQDTLAFYVNAPLFFQLAAAYMAGVPWNRFCDELFHLADTHIIEKKFKSREDYQRARIQVVLEGEAIADYIRLYRNLIRIARALSVLLFSYIIFVVINVSNIQIYINISPANKLVLLFVGILLLLLSIYSWHRLQGGYISAIYDASEVINQKNAPPTPAK